MNELDKSNGITNPLVLLQAAIERGLDPDKLGKLMDLAERWEANQAASVYAQAITEFQKRCPAIVKDRQAGKAGEKFNYAYAGYDDVMRVAGPLLAELQIAVSFTTEPSERGLKATCRLRVGTHFEDHSLTLPIPQMQVNDTQKFGAALSYAKRYVLCAALNIVTTGEDDDAGNQFDALAPEQIERLNELLADCREAGSPVDMPRFWGWLGCADMHEMRASDFAKAEHELTRKLAQAKKGKP